MAWVEALFRGADKVFVEVDDAGKLLTVNGKAKMRYKNAESAPQYSPFADKIALGEGGPVTPEPAAAPKPAAGKAEHIAYTDGACTGNPGPAGGGALVMFPDGSKIEKHRALGMSTNNVGELTGVLLAIEILEEAGVPFETRVDVHADSKYAIGVLSGEMKAKANADLIKSIRARLAKWPNLRWVWVRGHTGNVGNERADALARKGVEESKKRR